jgi:hypothetical protein
MAIYEKSTVEFAQSGATPTTTPVSEASASAMNTPLAQANPAAPDVPSAYSTRTQPSDEAGLWCDPAIAIAHVRARRQWQAEREAARREALPPLRKWLLLIVETVPMLRLRRRLAAALRTAAQALDATAGRSSP